MPYATQRDRDPHQLEIESSPYPVSPLNLSMTSGYEPGVINLTWDDAAQLFQNSRFQIIGVNVWRSFDSEFGPYDRVTTLPVGSNFWQDRTDNVLIPAEDVSDSFILRGVNSTGSDYGRYVFQTQYPIVKAGSQATPANSPDDVLVMVDGVQARVKRVDGFAKEVELDTTKYYNTEKQNQDTPVYPGDNSVVTCAYRYNRTLLKTDLAQRVFYRVTTVGLPEASDLSAACCEDLRETPLERAPVTSTSEIEKLDYIWREGIRRNRWILFQGGERVKVFIKKHVGPICPCRGPHYESFHQPQNDCELCFGAGILGGYEGPYDIIIAPDDAERRIAQRDVGRTVEHTYEVWTGPSPLLSQRDFLVKINGERYSIGAVRFPSNRGMVLQQHFNISRLDEQDIRYKVRVTAPCGVSANVAGVGRALPGIPPGSNAAVSLTEKCNIPDEREIRGRTVTWKNITF